MNLTEKLKSMEKDEFKKFSQEMASAMKKMDESFAQYESAFGKYTEAKSGMKSLLRDLLWDKEVEVPDSVPDVKDPPIQTESAPTHVFINYRGKIQFSMGDIDDDALSRIKVEMLAGIPRNDRYYNRHEYAWEILKKHQVQVVRVAFKYNLNVSEVLSLGSPRKREE